MDSLFPEESEQSNASDPQLDGQPLASRMRPQSIGEIAGQQHILAEGSLLRRAIEADRFSSLIFYGPPGTGKTTIASVIANSTNSRFEMLNGVDSNVGEIRDCIAQARTWKQLRGKSTILFIDEIHRFNKAQQDVLLPHIEKGSIRFIGATTHNPYYYVNAPLTSRSQIFQLEPVSEEDIVATLERAIHDPERGFGKHQIELEQGALSHLAKVSDGDVRKALSALELAVLSSKPSSSQGITLDLKTAEESIQQKAIVYDAKGDAHYDTISAFIKSIRGSDPDAALYWLAKMLYAGEDPRFISRRLVISASEDIGLADSNALRVAMDAHQAFETLGMPEGRIPLAHATVYLATAPKSNSAYAALGAATDDIKNGTTLTVPPHLRTPTRKKILEGSHPSDQSTEYFYSHNFEGNYIPQAYLPEGRTYYQPTENGLEKRIKERLAYWQGLHQNDTPSS
ncbi:replication-associated recombination protein A [Rubritalea marina]|uniref:replication-associated recombination protein A n=1 Tax=Rubritalea marina TaxID=361055 RepID=UPI0003753368|nr:replication-associated recombination protein A [Rubritalea marina]